MIKRILGLFLTIVLVFNFSGCSYGQEFNINPIKDIPSIDIELKQEQITHVTDNLFCDNFIEANQYNVGQTTTEEFAPSEESVIVNTEQEKTEPEVEEAKVTFETVEKIMYVSTSTLNIRTGPGIEYNKIGSFSLNDEVKVIGIGSNNWNKILWNNQEVYVSGNYLSNEKIVIEEPKTESVLEEMQRRGNIGRLKIADVGLNVALFETTIYDASKNRPVVDREDSAAYMTDTISHFGCIIIADHQNQGFCAIKKAIAGQTIAIIDFGTYQQEYICSSIFTGHNTGSDIVDNNYNTVKGDYGSICMYTCNENWQNITITLWQPV